MENATILLVVLAALAVMMAVFLFATARRRDTARALKDTTPTWRAMPIGCRFPSAPPPDGPGAGAARRPGAVG